MVGTHHSAVVFGIEVLGQLRRVHQVAEQHRDLAALGLRGVADGLRGACCLAMRDGCVHDLWRCWRPVGPGIRRSDGEWSEGESWRRHCRGLHDNRLAWDGYRRGENGWCLTRPDEALTLLIAGHLLEEEFAAHVFQQPLVETENIGEPAVRDAPVTLEHCPHFWEQRMEPALDRCPALGVWLGGCWIPRPDQNAAFLIHREALAEDELVLEVVQRRVVELELSLERAIGQATPLAQQGNRLIHHRDKVHPVSSLPGARLPYACSAPS